MAVFFRAQRLPSWWRWYFWANPVSWSLYGLLTSQLGDSDRLITLADGFRVAPIRVFLRDHFGFHHDFLGVVAFMVVLFGALFAVIYALAIRYLKFQKR